MIAMPSLCRSRAPRLYRIAHGVCADALVDAPRSARFPPHPGSVPERQSSAAKAYTLPLCSQAQKTRDYYDHDHHTDDVKDVHCVLLRVTDAICLWDGKSAIGAHRPRLVMDAKALLEQPCAQGPT